jgi:hypothetical protein
VRLDRTAFKTSVWPDRSFSFGKTGPDRKDSRPGVLDGITRGYLGQIEFVANEGDQIVDSVSSDQLSDLWLQYERDGNEDGCRRVLEALADWAERHPDLAAGGGSPMGLSDATKLRNRSRRSFKTLIRRGLGGITRRAKRKVRSAATLLDQKYGRGRLSFATLTLPVLSDTEHLQVSRQWDYVSARVREEIQREMQRAGLPSSEIVGVTEVQEKRYEKWGVVCLHLHLLFLGRKVGEFWAIGPDKLREIWERVLSSPKVLGRSISCTTGTRIEKLRTSAAKEMAKYLSKGTKIINLLISDHKESYIPSAWYLMGRELGREVERSIDKVQTRQVDLIFDNLWLLKTAGILDYRLVSFEVPDRVVQGEVISWKSIVCGASGFWRCENWKQFLCDSTEDLIGVVKRYLDDRRIVMSAA